MLMVLLYKVKTHFSPRSSGHPSHLSSNTDQIPSFFQDTSCPVMSLCSCAYSPCSELFLPRNLCLDSSYVSLPARLNVFSPAEPSNLPGSARCCFLCVPSAFCPGSVSVLAVLEIFSFRLGGFQQQGPSLVSGFCVKCISLPNRPGIVTSQ